MKESRKGDAGKDGKQMKEQRGKGRQAGRKEDKGKGEKK